MHRSGKNCYYRRLPGRNFTVGGTLKTTCLCLLTGALLLLAGLLLIDMDSWRASSHVDPVYLDASNGRINNKPAATGTPLSLTLPESGFLTVGLKFAQPLATADYRYLHLSLYQDGRQGRIAIAPRQADPQSAQAPPYMLENRHRQSLWINTVELPGFNGELSALYLSLFGEPGTRIEVRDVSLHGPSVARRLASLYDDWTVYEPWDRAAMNTHTGVTRVSSFYPLILAAGWLFLSLGCYILLVLVARGRRRFDWQVVGLTVLACWLLLDLAWQQRLLFQAADTRGRFAGLSTEEKLRVGPDAKIIAFVEQLRAHIPQDARVFVMSDDDYEALRTAYYLYPRNVFWRMKFGLPTQEFIRSGDYITVMTSPHVRYKPQEGSLRIPDTGLWPVDRLVNERLGKLYRVR